MSIYVRRCLLGSSLALAFVTACGGGDDGETNAAAGTGGTQAAAGVGAAAAGGAGSSAGPAGSSGAATTLGDNVAGTACTQNTDCGASGTCAADLPGSAFDMLLGGVASALPAPGGYCTLSCMTAAMCGAGSICTGVEAMGMAFAGQCLKGCATDADCGREGYRCANAGVDLSGFMLPNGGVPSSGGEAPPAVMGCLPVPPTAMLQDQVAGAACATAADCPAQGECLLMTEANPLIGAAQSYPGGYCSGDCLLSADCGAGGACVLPPVGGGAGRCLQACAADADCRTADGAAPGHGGYRCRAAGNEGVRGCALGAPPLADAVVGIACTPDAAGSDASATCGGARCASQLGGGFMAAGVAAPGGYCTTACLDDADCGGGACLGSVAIPGFGAALEGSCYARCTTAADCREGYACEARSNPFAMDAEAPTVCQPASMAASDAGT